MWILALTWLKANWKIALIGLAVVSLLGYIGLLRWQVSHYKTAFQDAKAELAAAAHREEQLEAANAGITRKYQESLKDLNAQVDKTMEVIGERIAKDEELASIKLSLNAARLFNQSKRDPSAKAPQAKQGDAGKASTPDASAYSRGLSVPLTAIFTVVARNDANHWKCVKQVDMWQNFWGDYEQAVQQAAKP
jgi:hypothetical protein